MQYVLIHRTYYTTSRFAKASDLQIKNVKGLISALNKWKFEWSLISKQVENSSISIVACMLHPRIPIQIYTYIKAATR